MIIKTSEKGQALVLIVLAAVALFAFAALAIDGSAIFSDRRHAQNAADTAALEAALTKTRGGDWTTEGLDRAQSNGYDDGVTNDVFVYNPPISGPYLGNAEYVQVKIKSDVNLYFARVIGRSKATNYVEAVARATPSEYTEMFYGNAVVGLAPTECKAVKFGGTGDTEITGGGIFVMSSCPSAAFFNNSSAVDLAAPSLCAVGGIVYNPDSLENVGSIATGCIPPPQIVEPNPQCSGPAHKSGNTLSPGTWNGQFPPAGVDTLESGIYCVDGDFRLNGGQSLTGIGVVIRMDDGVVNWNGGAEVHLEAPTEGAFSGLLLYMPSATNCSTITLNGNSASVIVGSILAPCADIQVNGTGDSGIEGQVIGYTVDISGTAAMNIHYDDSKKFEALTLPAIELTQ